MCEGNPHSAVKFDLVVHTCGKKKLGREDRTRMDVFSCKEGEGIRFGGGKESHKDQSLISVECWIYWVKKRCKSNSVFSVASLCSLLGSVFA